MGVHTPSGDLRWLRVDSHPITEDDEIVSVATFFVDITAQRGAEGALLQAQGRLKMASEAGRVGVFEWDPAVERMSCDEPAARIVGCPALEKTGSLDMLLSAIHPDDRERAAQEIQAAFASAAPVEASYRVVHADGSVRSILVQAGATTADDGSTRVTGAIVDVSNLRAANQRVVELLESMTEAYLTVDSESRFTYLNSAAEMLLGRVREELLDRVVWEVFPDAVGSEFDAHYRQLMATGEPIAFEAFFAPTLRWYEVRAHVVDEGIAVYFRDVSERHAAEAERDRLVKAERTARMMAERARAELAMLATHDGLTGLPNRASLVRWLAERVDALTGDRCLAVCYVDLDRFERVNDGWGHSEGDRLLIYAARRLRAALRPEDFVARLGGDEFIVVLEGTTRSDLLRIAERLPTALRDPFELGGRQIVVTGSVGLVFATSETSPECLVRDADSAVHKAKEMGRDRIAVFDDRIRAAALARVEIETDLRAALDSGDVIAHYQPAFSLATGVPVGVEALARLEPPRPWPRSAGRVHPRGGGDGPHRRPRRPHPPDGRARRPHRLGRGRQSRAHGLGQRVAPPTGAAGLCRQHLAHPRRTGYRAGTAGHRGGGERPRRLV